MSNNNKYTFKIILLGDTNSGKTSFTHSIMSERLLDVNNPTIGVEFMSHNVELEDKTNVKLMIWDTAGQERYRTITKMYYKNIVGVFLFFDLTSRTSFINLKYWYNEIKRNVEDSNGIVFIIGNKLDLISNRAVTNEDILGFLEELDDKNTIKYKEISVKTSSSADIRELFKEIAEEVYLKIKENKINLKENTEIININYKEPTAPKKKCCSK